jgi:hypothetical protein
LVRLDFLAVIVAASCILGMAGEDAPKFQWQKVLGIKDASRVFPSTVEPHTVFVWTRAGLLVSNDDGKTFAARGNAREQLGTLTALLVHPAQPKTLYAGTLERGVFASDDAGVTWRALGGADKGLASPRIHSLIFADDDPTFSTFYATHSAQQAGVSMTIDGGKSWRVFASGYGVSELVIMGSTMLFAGARPAGGAETGFYRSLDAGKNWFRVLNVENPTALSAVKTERKRAWFGTASGLYVTDNLGVSSRAVGPQEGMSVASIAVVNAPDGGECVYVYEPTGQGVIASGDEFKTCRKLNDGLYVGDWVGEGASMVSAGSTLYVCLNGALYRGAQMLGTVGLNTIRANPEAPVAGQDAVTFTCQAGKGAEVTVDLSPLGGPANQALKDDGQSGDNAANDGVFGFKMDPIPLTLLTKAKGWEYKGPPLPGRIALTVRASLGGVSESGVALLTVRAPETAWTLWNGEEQIIATLRGGGDVSIAACQEHPFSGSTHLRLQVQGKGEAAVSWHRYNDASDTRGYKLLTFCIRSSQDGPSELKVALRDNGMNYGAENAQCSNELPLAAYLPRVTAQYQRVTIPMADLILGTTVAREHIRDVLFLAPTGEKRTYDIDDLAMLVKPGPIFTGAAARVAADGSALQVKCNVTGTSGAVKKVNLRAGNKEFALFDDGQHGDGESGDGVFAASLPASDLGSGAKVLELVASDADGAAEEKLAIFMPRRAPGQIAFAHGPVAIDGKLEEYAEVPAFAAGDDKLSLRARMTYDARNLYVALEVKDAAYNPQPPKKGERKPNLQERIEMASAELLFTSPAALSVSPRNEISPNEHRFTFVMDDKQGIAMRGTHRLPANGTRVEGGYVIEAQIPFDQLRVGRDACDFAPGKSTRIEWRLVGAGGTKLAWSAADYPAAANPEQWGLAYFAEEAGAPRLRYTASAGKMLTLASNKRLDAKSAQALSSYEIAGVQLQKALLEGDGRTLRLIADAPWRQGQSYTLTFKGLRSEDGSAAVPELVFSPLPGRPMNGEMIQEALIGELRENMAVEALKTAQIDESTKPSRGGKWQVASCGSGMFNLNELLGYQSNAIGHAHVYIYSESDRAAQVWLGSDDGARVVVNGAVVHVAAVHRGCNPDQDRVGIKLMQGWNSLLLAIWQSSGDWSFCLRLMDEKGNPPQGLSYSADNPDGGH